MFFVNLDALQEAGVDPGQVDPGNWDQLMQLGEQLHKMDGDKVVRTGFDTEAQDGRPGAWSWANGVDLISADEWQARACQRPQGGRGADLGQADGRQAGRRGWRGRPSRRTANFFARGTRC